MEARGRVILHAGTHKTGTKTLQAFLMENRLPFARAGIYIPATGRAELAPGVLSPGHHALAWDVLHGNTEQFAAVLADINAARPQRAAFLREAFAARGFAVTILLYVRAQAPYVESIYAELTKAAFPPPFGAFVDELLARGEVRLGESSLPFEYDRIVLALAACFGPQHIVVRPYVDLPESRALIDDFLHVVARLHGGLDLRDLRLSLAHANLRGSFAQVIARLAEHAGVAPTSLPALDAELAGTPFAPLRHEDTVALVERFAASNAALEEMAGITIAGARISDVPPASDATWATARAQRAYLDRLAGPLGGIPS